MMPKSLSLTVIYEGVVADVAGVTKEPVIVSEGFVFVELLREIFFAHPEIEQRFPAGSLGLLLNGKPPLVEDVLHDGDVVILTGSQSTISVS